MAAMPATATVGRSATTMATSKAMIPVAIASVIRTGPQYCCAIPLLSPTSRLPDVRRTNWAVAGQARRYVAIGQPQLGTCPHLCCGQSTTGLNRDQIEDLVAYIYHGQKAEEQCGPRGGRKPALGLYRSIVLTLVHLRSTLSQATLADLYGVSQSTVSRIVRRYSRLIGEVLGGCVPPCPRGQVDVWSWWTGRGCRPATRSDRSVRGKEATTRREHPDSVRPGRSPPGCLCAPSRIRARPPSNRSIGLGVITRLDADSRRPRRPRNIRRHAQPETTPTTTLARKRGHQPPPRPAPSPRGTRHRSPQELENPRHRIPRPPRRAFRHHPHHHRGRVLPPRLESVVNNAHSPVET